MTAETNFADPPSAASRGPELARELRSYLELCREFLALFTEENQALRRTQSWSPERFHRERKRLLPRLESGLIKLRSFRQWWERMPAGQRGSRGDVEDLFRDVQSLLPRLLLLDRENQQEMLRRGLIPAGQLPSAVSQRPNFVANLYRRHTAV
ncbi:MAG TPA: hypothetical protein VL970_05385 [Candidatus Acidoferrales bacterium]|nr:hypothetical protein [Candidatus Acidoferrales bacterium]